MKKFNKITTFFLSVFFIIAVLITSGCGNSTTTKTTNQETSNKRKLIGYCIPDTSEPFLANLSNSVKQMFEKEGVEVQIANAAGDANTQVSQIENFATMKADLIIVMAVDPTSVADAIKKAQASGCKVLVAGSDTGVYDAIMYIDQFEDGKMIAKMAADYISAKYPNAAPNSIEVAILESRDTPEASQRCDGMAEITKLCPAAKVVKVIGGIKNTDAAQAAAENLFQTNPNVKVVLCYNSGAGIGVNAYAMRPGSKITDKSDFAVFCSDLDPQSKQAVIDSASNKSVLRGVVKFGGKDLAADTYKLAKKMINGEQFNKKNPDPLTPITPENANEF